MIDVSNLCKTFPWTRWRTRSRRLRFRVLLRGARAGLGTCGRVRVGEVDDRQDPHGPGDSGQREDPHRLARPLSPSQGTPGTIGQSALRTDGVPGPGRLSGPSRIDSGLAGESDAGTWDQ